MQVMGQFKTVTAKNVPLRIYVISNDTDSLLSKKLVTRLDYIRVTCNKSAVSLLESGEWR